MFNTLIYVDEYLEKIRNIDLSVANNRLAKNTINLRLNEVRKTGVVQ